MLINKTNSTNITASSSVDGVEAVFIDATIDQDGTYNFNIRVNDADSFFENQEATLKDTTEALHEIVALANENYKKAPPAPESETADDGQTIRDADFNVPNLEMAE